MKAFEINVKKTVVFYLHGLRGHGLAQQAALRHIVRNLSVSLVSLELPGHGAEAATEQCMVPNYQRIVSDIVQEIHHRAGQAEQVVLMGYSFGGSLMTLAANELHNDATFAPQVVGLIGISTAFDVGHNVPRWQLRLNTVIAPISRFLHRYAPPLSAFVTIHEMNIKAISPDQTVQQAIANDDLMYKGRIPLSTSSQVYRTGLEAEKVVDALECPVLLLHSQDDSIALAPQKNSFANHVNIKLFKHLRHNCIDGLSREAVIARKAIVAFIAETL